MMRHRHLGYRRDRLVATTIMILQEQIDDGFVLPKHGSYGGLHIGALFNTMGVEDDIFSGNWFTTKY